MRYTFKVMRNGKDVSWQHKGTDDEVIAREMYEKIQVSLERYWSQFNYPASVVMYKDGKEIGSVDWET